MYNKIIEREKSFFEINVFEFRSFLSLSENHDDDANNDKITSKH